MKIQLISKIALVLAVVAVGFSCAYTWTGHPRNVNSNNTCDPWDEFPQMIRLPIFSKACQIVHSCDQYPGESTAIAISIFYMKWRMSFGDPQGKVWRALNRVMIDWSPELKRGNGYDTLGERHQGAAFGGLVLSPSYTWARPRQNEIICESALVHELVHISIWAVKGTDGDPDHMGSKYSGWTVNHSALIQKVNNALCELGI